MGKSANKKNSHAIGSEELTAEFLEHIHVLVAYWDNVERENTHEKLSGLAFSILSMLDGCTVNLPAFDLVARPHPTDKAYHIEQGENYINDGTVLEPWLHERFYAGKA